MLKSNLIFIFLILISCENSQENIANFVNEGDMPFKEVLEPEIMITQNGDLKLSISSNVMHKFDNGNTYFYGDVVIHFYKGAQVSTSLNCNEIMLDELKNMMTAKGSVLLFNDSQSLSTEELFLDRTESLIYSDAYVSVITENKDTINADQFRSNLDFTNPRFIGVNRSTINNFPEF